MSDNRTSRDSAKFPLLSVVGLAAGLSAILWFLTREERHWLDHFIGPYHVPIALERWLGALALTAFVPSVVWMARSSRRALDRGVLVAPTVLTILAVVYATLAWRATTQSYDGADIGRGLVWEASPPVIGALVTSAVVIQQRRRRAPASRLAWWSLMAALVVPLLYLFERVVD